MENVTEAQQYNQILVDEAQSIVDRTADDLLNRRQLPNDADEMLSVVRRARLELELVEQMLATEREVGEDDE